MPHAIPKMTIVSPLQDCKDAALRVAEAEANVQKIRLRILETEHTSAISQKDKLLHQQLVTTALLEGKPIPAAPQPPCIVASDAVLLLKKELEKAEARREELVGDSRATVVRLVESKFEQASIDYQKALDRMRDTAIDLIALDRLLLQSKAPFSKVPNTMRGRLFIPSIDRNRTPDLTGEAVMGSKDAEARLVAIRRNLTDDLGTVLPF